MAIRDREHTDKSKQPTGQKKQPVPEAKQERQAEAKRKPAPQRAAPRKNPKSPNAFIRYLQDTGDELRKVSWPTREQAIRLTVVVLGSTLAAAAFFGVLDFLFQKLAALLI
jgi:preprotein translocase subunit SecE